MTLKNEYHGSSRRPGSVAAGRAARTGFFIMLILSLCSFSLLFSRGSADSAGKTRTPNSREAFAELLHGPVLKNPFRQMGWSDVPIKLSSVSRSRIKIQEKVYELKPGRWCPVTARVMDTPDKSILMETDLKLLIFAKYTRILSKPPVYRTFLRSGGELTNQSVNTRLIVIRIPRNTLTLYSLNRKFDRYQVLRQYTVSVGRPNCKTPIGGGFVYTKGPVVFKYLWGTNQDKVIEMVSSGPDGLTKIPMPFDKMKGLYMDIEGHDRFVIHSTTEFWNMGRIVSMGCVRMTIDNMLDLFPLVDPGTTIRILYDTIELDGDRLKLYPDVYKREGDRTRKIAARLVQAGYPDWSLDWNRIRLTAESTNTRIVRISDLQKKGVFVRLAGIPGKRESERKRKGNEYADLLFRDGQR